MLSSFHWLFTNWIEILVICCIKHSHLQYITELFFLYHCVRNVRTKCFDLPHTMQISPFSHFVLAGKAQVLLTPRMTLSYSSVPIRYDTVTMRQHAQNQDLKLIENTELSHQQSYDFNTCFSYCDTFFPLIFTAFVTAVLTSPAPLMLHFLSEFRYSSLFSSFLFSSILSRVSCFTTNVTFQVLYP